jgi:alanyl-tRNA synthetase
VWNNVFIQFNREEGGGLRPLPARHVDTGMGLERLVSVLQNVRSNYDTDVFAPIFEKIEHLTGAHPYMGRLGAADKGNVDTAYRVIADHIRTLTFAITDGAVPSNVGRGYVLRRVLRRAVRYGRQVLGARTGFFSQLVPVVVGRFGSAFPELRKDPARVAAIILEEEESFGKTLDRGIRLFEEVAQRGAVSGEDAFRLYDTYGFPIDLTVQMAQERGLSVDQEGFEREMEAAKERSRAVEAKGDQKRLSLTGDEIARLRHMGVEPTNDGSKFDAHDIRARVKAIWNGQNFDEHARPSVGPGRTVGIVTDRTCFYATMGGQEHDTGKIAVTGPHPGVIEVHDVQVFGGFVLHIGRIASGEVRVGDWVDMEIDKMRRARIASNHTATHLANFALRGVLGPGVEQKGSLVAEDRFRFDFSHNQPVGPEQLKEVERVVAAAIRKDLAVYAEPAALGTARQITGVRAVFGEVYPDPVRVVSIGQPVPDLLSSPGNPAWGELSVEFCGGTHVSSTAIIEHFAVTGEEAVAKGIRRITALTGAEALAANRAAEAMERRVGQAAALPDADLARAVQALLTDLEAGTMPSWRKAELRGRIVVLQERIKAAGKALAAAAADAAVREARAIAESALMANEAVIVNSVRAGEDRQALSAAVSAIRQKCPRAAVMLFSVEEGTGKVSVAAAVPDALVARGLRAGDWLREACALVGGKGGGKPDQAQGGGTLADKVPDAMKHARVAALRVAT